MHILQLEGVGTDDDDHVFVNDINHNEIKIYYKNGNFSARRGNTSDFEVILSHPHSIELINLKTYTLLMYMFIGFKYFSRIVLLYLHLGMKVRARSFRKARKYWARFKRKFVLE